jgi:hypothetical protein
MKSTSKNSEFIRASFEAPTVQDLSGGLPSRERVHEEITRLREVFDLAIENEDYMKSDVPVMLCFNIALIRADYYSSEEKRKENDKQW